MNWDAIGAIGEILGAFGVIVTLIYLARKIRESNQAARQAAMQEVLDRNSELLSQISTYSDNAQLFVKGCANDSNLTEFELIQYRSYLWQLNILWERTYFLNQSGNLDSWIWEDLRIARLNVMSSAGFKSYFNARKDSMNAQWRKYLEEELSKTRKEYLPFGLHAE